MKLNTASSSNSFNQRNNNPRCQTRHFIFREFNPAQKGRGDTFYLYKGMSFKDPDGFELVMMAKHYPDLKEIRLFSSNHIGVTQQKNTQMGRVSSKFKLGKANSQRKDKIAYFPFDFENSHVAKVFINNNTKKYSYRYL